MKFIIEINRELLLFKVFAKFQNIIKNIFNFIIIEILKFDLLPKFECFFLKSTWKSILLLKFNLKVKFSAWERVFTK